MPSSSSISPLPLLLALALGLAGCSDGGGGAAADPTVTALAVSPGGQIDPIGATRQFTATATYDNGSSGDVTSSVTWTSSATGVATVNAAGLATAAGAGALTLSAAHAASERSASASYTVHYASQGTAGAPKALGEGQLYTGSVGKGTSYYVVSGLAPNDDGYTVSLSELSDDADLVVFDQTDPCTPLGRIANESCPAVPTAAGQLFIAVGGADSVLGTSFKLLVEAGQPPGLVGEEECAPKPEGSANEPLVLSNPLRTGSLTRGKVSSADGPGTPSYFAVPALSSARHRVALSSFSNGNSVAFSVFGDQAFETLLGSQTSGESSVRTADTTPTGDTFYVRVQANGGGDCFTLSALPAEGSVAEPVTTVTKKSTRLVVDTTASYYRMAVSPGTSYPVSMSNTATPRVKATVYDSNGFSGTSLCTYDDEGVTCPDGATPSGDALYIMLDGSGSEIGGLLELCIGDCPRGGVLTDG
jgi:hypothetical protein